MLGPENFEVPKIVGPKEFWVPENVWSQNFWVLKFLGPEKSLTAVGHNFVNLLHHSHQDPILISSFDLVWRLAGTADEENG